MRNCRCGILSTALVICHVLQARCLFKVSSCDRVRSRLARDIVQKYIEPKVQELGYQYPTVCQLNTTKDVYHVHEEAKIRLRGGGAWRCGQCGRVFRSEDFLDSHLVSQHPLPDSHVGDVCLADVAALLHAERFAEKLAPTPGRQIVDVHDAYSPHSYCPPSVAEQRRLACLELGEACFPATGGPAAHLLHDLFAGTLCKAHTCDSRAREALLDRLAQTRRRPEWPFLLLLAVLLLLMGLGYAVFAVFHLQHGGYSTPGDMVRVRGKKGQLWPRLTKKPKTY